MITNKYSLPQQIVSAVSRDTYVGSGDISATSLIMPPRIVQLRIRHGDKLVEDASDRIWSAFGKAIHTLLENADQTGALHEQRMETEVLGWQVSCGTDVYATQHRLDNGLYVDIPPTIRDYKLVKISARKFDHPEWEQQLQINAHIWIEEGWPVNRLENVLIYRDWAPGEAVRIPGYPPPVEVIKYKVWDRTLRFNFIESRVGIHKSASKLPDEMLPFCTPTEQWRQPAKWAVLKVMDPGRAKKLCATREEADAWILAQHAKQIVGKHVKYTVEHRPESAMRCEHYCEVRPFCNQYDLEMRRENRGVQKSNEKANAA